MKKKVFALISSLLVFSMLAAPLASCNSGSRGDETEQNTTTGGKVSESTEKETQGDSTEKDTQIGDSTESGGSGNETTTGNGQGTVTTEKDPDSETTEKKPSGETTEKKPSGETTEGSGNTQETTENKGSDDKTETTYGSYNNAELIEFSNSIKNGVNYYYPNAKRETAVIENLEMSLEYGLLTNGNKQVTYLKNAAGASYIENTMDVFIRMTNGSTYYASTSKASTTSNLFRLGYYFYQARYEGQNFLNSAKVLKTKSILLKNGLSKANDMTLVSNDDGVLNVKMTSDGKGSFDPYIVLSDGSHASRADSPYTMLEITLKAEDGVDSGQIYINTGSGFNADQQYKFTIIGDGNYHTYTVPLFNFPGYEGTISGIRFDFNGDNQKEITIKNMDLVIAEISDLPVGLSIARTFNVYSDKMHHTIQVSAETETSNIASVGMLTKISADTVNAVILKDKNGVHDTINGADWASVEYIGFAINGAGVFGYILPADNGSGTLSVTLKDGIYHIEQTATPEGGVIKPSEEGTNNGNDFFMGQRIYTDTNNDFAEFVYEAECERNPIPSKYFRIMADSSDDTAYVGYDALRGIYVFSYKYNAAGRNDYPTVKFSIKGDDLDRKIYVMAYSDSSTVVETAVLLNESDMYIPVLAQVGKNFSEAAGERNLYNIDDPVYSEAIFPIIVHKGEMVRYSMVNAYFKWGKYPLKQVSWIQFRAPYYHLSTAMTETNCITPYYTTRTSRNLSVLPDFRAMSAPPFSGDQRNSGGHHYFLRYTDADGNYITSENTVNTVGSHGPIYADVTMKYLTDDGKIKVTYNHMEMPQEDENRTYYEMSYEILEDISFKDFAKDFSFYSVTSIDPVGVYTLLGYLDEGGTSRVVDAKMAGDDAVYYTLGKNAPYFSYMKMTDDRANKSGYVNLAFIVSEAEFVIGGEKADPNFVLADLGGMLSVSLNYGDITLKKGDSIKINCILMPWGSQETVYDGSNGKAPDQNVLDVRQNSIFDPLRAEAVKDCEVIDTAFLPTLNSTNGSTAEFTIKGGNDNCAVRIGGFDKLTVPKIYELIDGEWVAVKLSSAYHSLNQDTTRKYDGYGVHYDGDGKFAYSFIVAMDNGQARTFKIDASKNFAGTWLDIDKSEIVSNYLDPNSKYSAADNLFVFHVDFINGKSDDDDNDTNGKKFSYNSTSSSGVVELMYNGETTPERTMTFSGWVMLESGVSKFMWSLDGKDWYECAFSGSTTAATCSSAVIEAANKSNVGYEFTTDDAKGGGFAGKSALVIDLSDYAGQTVNVYIGAIPNENPEILSVFTVINGVNVLAKSEDETETTKPEETEPPTENEAPEELGTEMNLVVSGKDLFNMATSDKGGSKGFASIEFKDGYTRFTNTNGSDASFNVFKDNTSETGKYLVIKYRLPSNNASKVATFRFHISTTRNVADTTNGFYSSATLISDDAWHLLVIDMKKYEDERTQTNEFLMNEADGRYYAQFLRLYIFSDTRYLDGTYIDIEYVGMCNSFDTIKVCNKDMQSIQLSERNASTPYYTIKTNNFRYLDPTSGYTLADKYFCFHTDSINGKSDNDNDSTNGKFYSFNSVSNKGIVEKNLNETIGTTLNIKGWCPLEGGISKYMWSVDGKTWYQCGGTPTNNGSSVLSAASGQMSGAYTYTETDGINGGFSGGLTIDLSAFAGQTVDVRIAAIPEGSTNELCVLVSLNGLTVTAS